MPEIQSNSLDSESDPKNPETEIAVEVPVEFYDAFNFLNSDIEHLLWHHEIKLPLDYTTSRGIQFKQKYDLQILSEYINEQHSELKNNRPWENRHNLIYQRDLFLIFAMDAKIAANIFAIHECIDSAWSCLNIGTFHYARAAMITEVDVRIQSSLLKKQTRKSQEASNQITKNAQKSFVELFKNNAPPSGWETLKVALHEIRPHLIKELKAKKPTSDQQVIDKALEDLLEKFVSWMRIDSIFKSQIDRHIQNRIVPDLTNLE